ncbi:MAG: GNAT family N-acetyltransferase [Polyangiaceae bacterium]
MRVERIDGAEAFLARGQRFFEAGEVEHGLLVGVAGEVRAGACPVAARFALVEDEHGQVIGAALRTPPHKLVIAGQGARIAEALADGWREPDGALPGVTGSLPAVDVFAARWCEARGLAFRTELDLRLHVLREVGEVRSARGRFRAATLDDLEFTARAMEAFAAHLGAREPDKVATARRSLQSGVLSVWEDGGAPVTLVRVSGATPRGVRVSMVYTPPEHRGRGYATSCVAEVSRRQLAAGRAHCMLFTDVHAPIPNRIYARIGYRPVADMRSIDFEQR